MPATVTVAVNRDDKVDIWNRISPVFSSGPSCVHTPTCFIVNGPAYSLASNDAFSVTVAVNSHSPSTPA